jgi:hypothetical protein
MNHQLKVLKRVERLKVRARLDHLQSIKCVHFYELSLRCTTRERPTSFPPPESRWISSCRSTIKSCETNNLLYSDPAKRIEGRHMEGLRPTGGLKTRDMATQRGCRPPRVLYCRRNIHTVQNKGKENPHGRRVCSLVS